MSRRNIKPTTFHDDSRSSDAGSVVAVPTRTKQRTVRDSAKDLLSLGGGKYEHQQNGVAAKQPLLGPDGEIMVCYCTWKWVMVGGFWCVAGGGVVEV
jgi:hypothetical protein